MSWWVSLQDHENLNEWDEPETVLVDRHAEGGTYALGGTQEASLNVTYNYSRWYYWHLHADGLRYLDGRLARRTVDRLRHAIEFLGTERSRDYWEPTPGNAGHALSVLLGWAEQHPEAMWRVN